MSSPGLRGLGWFSSAVEVGCARCSWSGLTRTEKEAEDALVLHLDKEHPGWDLGPLGGRPRARRRRF